MRPIAIAIVATLGLAACGAPKATPENITKQVEAIKARKNAEKALKNLREMAQAGSHEAAMEVGTILSEEKYYAADVRTACNHFEFASAKVPAAMHQLARCYERGGFDGKKDPVKAQATYEKAMQMGWTKGRCDYGAMLIKGKAPNPSDPVKGAALCEEGAKSGDAAAAFKLANMYMLGDGVKMNKAKGKEMFELASNAGDGNASLWLGSMYNAGDGVPKSEAEAIKWWTKAFEQGRGEGAQYVGDKAYERAKKGDKAAIAEAEAWYAKAKTKTLTNTQQNQIKMNLDEMAKMKA